MARFQVIVSKDGRDWHSIRDDERSALYRVGEHMMMSDIPDVFVLGENARYKLTFGASTQSVIDLLRDYGFSTVIKKIID